MIFMCLEQRWCMPPPLLPYLFVLWVFNLLQSRNNSSSSSRVVHNVVKYQDKTKQKKNPQSPENVLKKDKWRPSDSCSGYYDDDDDRKRRKENYKRRSANNAHNSHPAYRVIVKSRACYFYFTYQFRALTFCATWCATTATPMNKDKTEINQCIQWYCKNRRRWGKRVKLIWCRQEPTPPNINDD